MKRPFILACWLAAIALVAGACDGTSGLTAAGGSLFPAAPSAPQAPGSTSTNFNVFHTTIPTTSPGVIPAVVILNGTDPIYP